MNKINRFLLVYMITITTLCIYMCYLAFYQRESNEKLVNKVQSTIAKDEVKDTTKAKKKKTTYHLAIREDELVVVTTQTKEIFEYTDIKKEHLPVEIQKMLKNKTLFYSPEEVYHFLESYSS